MLAGGATSPGPALLFISTICLSPALIGPPGAKMKRKASAAITLTVASSALLVFGIAGSGCSTTSPASMSSGAGASMAYQYPEAHTVDQVDVFHGVEVADPYRWLEDPDSSESRAWIEAENEITFDYLGGVPQRGAIEDRLTELWDYERFGTPFKEGGRYFYTRNDGLQNQSVLYVADSLSARPRVLLDPNTFSDDGTVSLAGYAVSDNGRYIAYGTSDGGSDWRTWQVRDIETGKNLPDTIDWVKFSGASWTKDSKGFFYSRYDEPTEGEELQSANYYQKLFYHKLGDPQRMDRLIYERPDHKDWGFGGGVTDDGRYLIVGVWKGTENKNRVFYKDLSYPQSEVIELLNDADASYSFIDNNGPVFWFQTDLDAPKGRVIAIDTRRPQRGAWKEIIAESDDVLQGINTVGGRFLASYLNDVKTEVRQYGLDGGDLGEIDLPGIGSAFGFGGKRSDSETFFAFSSFTTPTTIYRYDVATGETDLFRKPDVKFNADDYTTEQVFYRSKDGARIPMFISFKKGMRRNGANPTLLYGYGGFNISIRPSFSVSNLVWMEMGGIYAVANIRGGGEYGEEWHQAGMKLNKQNVFDDFIAAAEHLIRKRYTRSDKLGIFGGSNGGLLVGACLTQRPELFGAAMPAVGVLDMLRFHKFTIGWAWVSDYGSVEDKDEFEALYGYSPYHNIKKGVCYPPTLITTADHDDRVVPAHSFKFAAALQAAQGCDNPILIRVETRAGHGAGTPTSKTIEQTADRWSFLVRSLKMDPDLH